MTFWAARLDRTGNDGGALSRIMLGGVVDLWARSWRLSLSLGGLDATREVKEKRRTKKVVIGRLLGNTAKSRE